MHSRERALRCDGVNGAVFPNGEIDDDGITFTATPLIILPGRVASWRESARRVTKLELNERERDRHRRRDRS